MLSKPVRKAALSHRSEAEVAGRFSHGLWCIISSTVAFWFSFGWFFVIFMLFLLGTLYFQLLKSIFKVFSEWCSYRTFILVYFSWIICRLYSILTNFCRFVRFFWRQIQRLTMQSGCNTNLFCQAVKKHVLAQQWGPNLCRCFRFFSHVEGYGDRLRPN